MYEAMAAAVQKNGGQVLLGREAVELHHADGLIKTVLTNGEDGSHAIAVSHCFSSMPITELVRRMRPRPPEVVLEAADKLRYRSIITVNLLFDHPSPLQDNWIYLHSPEIAAGRLQLYHNWSPDMVPKSDTSALGFEYFCFEDDALWRQSDSELIQLALADLGKLGFYRRENFLDGFVVRYAKAYPMYEDHYEKHLGILKGWLSQFANLDCIGRYGQFRYNNMDHSIMTGLLAVRRMLGAQVDPWSVNAEAAYLEENPPVADQAGGRASHL
jgi:protoporphyrinogen oxidase